jgi:hypothetical protein
MRRCRVAFVSPPETNNNSQCLVITTECNCISNKNHSTSPIKTVNSMFSTIQKSNHVDHGRVKSAQNQIAVCQFCNVDLGYDGAFIINKYFETNGALDVLLIFELLFQRIHNIYTSDARVCCLAVIYSYFSCVSVIVSNYNNIKRLCLIKPLICLILQLSLPKKLIEPPNPGTSYLKKSEKVRVVYPLSKWITTSPKKYLSKLVLNGK